MSLLTLQKVCYSYDDRRQALDQVSLSINQGERIAVLGANGAGKSTLFALLNGVLRPTAGEIWRNGAPLAGKAHKTLCQTVGMVFQESDHQLIAATVQADVAFGPSNLRLPKPQVQAQTEEAIRQMDLIGMERRHPRQLSGGEKKRVAIAGVLAMHPQVLLFDEPFSSLDVQTAETLEQRLEALSASGKTLLVSTHDVDFAWRFADRLLILGGGKLLFDGAPAAAFANHALLQAAHLKPPLLWRVAQSLAPYHPLFEHRAPKTLEELTTILKEEF